MSADEWMDRIDSLGLAAPLDNYRELLREAPAHVRESPQYHWAVGFVDGRAVIEEFGGVKP